MWPYLWPYSVMRTEIIKVRVSPEEKQMFETKAAERGIPVSSWIREQCHAAWLRVEMEKSVLQGLKE